ncbi:MAG: lytic transglycosylase domain-containing protein [Pseudomonadota bacterium]
MLKRTIFSAAWLGALLVSPWFAAGDGVALPLPRVAAPVGVAPVAAPLPRVKPGARQEGAQEAASQPQSPIKLSSGKPFPRAKPRTVASTPAASTTAAPSAYRSEEGGAVGALIDAASAAAQGGALPQVPQETAPRTTQPVKPQGALAIATHGRADASAFTQHGRTNSSLKGALDALKANRYSDAIKRRNGLSDPLDRLIVDYYLVRAAPKQLTDAMVLDFAARAKGWPSPTLIRERYETMLARQNTAPAAAIAALGDKAQSIAGHKLLAKSYLASGKKAKAAAVARSVWHNKPMGRAMQKSFAADLGAVLTVDDHLHRADMLVGAGKVGEASALRERLGKGPRAYVDTLVAAAKGDKRAKNRLSAVSSRYKSRPGYTLATVEIKRRADDFSGAARIIEGVDPRRVANGDAWWVETRIVARSLAERGKRRRAYKLAAKGFARSAKSRADEAFHAGWLSLTGLKDGRRSEAHFKALADIATTPLSRSRAAYWRGRAAQQRGDGASERRHFYDAAAYGFTYYGQLARAELNRSGTGVQRAPRPSAADRSAFSANSVAKAVKRLIAAGHEHRVWPLLKHLANTVPTAGQAALVVELGEKAGTPHLSVMAAKAVQRRGLPIGRLAYPTKHIPKKAKVPQDVERAVVYAIARQESLFNPVAKSPVGAAGLMQLMPRTATAMARELGVRHSQSRLTRDPAHNATLGAAYLKKRLGNFDGSYILTFAAYNAGAGRVYEWIERFGDPRQPGVDPIQWVEQIPYPETRNYVQRVMENVQVYREALGQGRLAIRSDLRRGRRS